MKTGEFIKLVCKLKTEKYQANIFQNFEIPKKHVQQIFIFFKHSFLLFINLLTNYRLFKDPSLR